MYHRKKYARLSQNFCSKITLIFSLPFPSTLTDEVLHYFSDYRTLDHLQNGGSFQHEGPGKARVSVVLFSFGLKAARPAQPHSPILHTHGL